MRHGIGLREENEDEWIKFILLCMASLSAREKGKLKALIDDNALQTLASQNDESFTGISSR